MIDTIVGGLLAIAGGFAATWFQARRTRKTRMEEVIAERKVQANQEAYVYMKELEGTLIGLGPDRARKLMAEREEWWAASRIFLPGRYADKWLAIRLKLDEILLPTSERIAAGESKPALLKRTRELIRECLLEVYKDMNLEELDVET